MRSLLFTPTAFNWFLIIICAVVGVLTLVLALYLLIIFQHPDDKNQAWLPKLVVILGISVSIWTVLLFPLDVANSQACALDVPLTYCDFTLPMEALWYACYIAVTLLAFAIIPFAMFYYEADSDW
jgi:LMBR1 domain-containing protein 1